MLDDPVTMVFLIILLFFIITSFFYHKNKSFCKKHGYWSKKDVYDGRIQSGSLICYKCEKETEELDKSIKKIRANRENDIHNHRSHIYDV